MKYEGKSWVQFAKMLSSNTYTKYIKDPFNNEMIMSYLEETLARSKNTLSKNGPLLPPYSIFFESLTLDVGPLEKGVRFIDARHYNSYLIVPRLV
jgi:hypothetical protein